VLSGDTGTPNNTPTDNGDTKPTSVPNLFVTNNNGLSGGTSNSNSNDDGTLDDPPSF
jgi:hypothetical protein